MSIKGLNTEIVDSVEKSQKLGLVEIDGGTPSPVALTTEEIAKGAWIVGQNGMAGAYIIAFGGTVAELIQDLENEGKYIPPAGSRQGYKLPCEIVIQNNSADLTAEMSIVIGDASFNIASNDNYVAKQYKCMKVEFILTGDDTCSYYILGGEAP